MGRFGDFLVSEGGLRPGQLEKVMEMQQLVGGRLGTNVLELGLMREEPLLDALGRFRRTRTAAADELRGVSPDVLRLVPPQIARRHLFVPIRHRGHTLVLAAKDPGDPLVEDELGYLTSCLVSTVVGLEVRIHEALERYYQVPAPTRLSGLARRLNGAGERRPAAVAEAAPSAPEPVAPPPAAAPPRQPVPSPPPAPPRPAVPARPSEARPKVQYIELDDVSRARIYAEESVGRTPQERLYEASEWLQKSSIRDEIGDALLEYSKPYLKRRILLIQRREAIVGWRGEGGGVDREKVRAIEIPAGEPSVFLTLQQGTDFWLGPLAPLPAHRSLVDALETRPPKDCLVLPVRLRSRVVCFLYGDNRDEGSGAVPVAELKRLAIKAGVAFEVCILKNKIRTL